MSQSLPAVVERLLGIRTPSPEESESANAQGDARPVPPPTVRAAAQAQSLSAGPGVRRNPQPVPPSAPLAQPEDIQIHIGRIEVMAVPQAAPRAAVSAPARKGLSLDEYLSRRNGRAR